MAASATPKSRRWEPAGGGVTGELIRTKDWSETALGDLANWPQSLRTIVSTMLASRHPMFLFWGPDLIQLYNDAYLPSFGAGKHPASMGQRGPECWGEIWPIIGPQIEVVMTDGTPTWHEDALVPIHRNGAIEEVFWTYGYSPVFAENDPIAGVLVVCTETTSGVLANRRLRLVASLTESAAAAADPDAVLDCAFMALAGASEDIPFAAVFDPISKVLTHSFGITEGKDALVKQLAGLVSSGPRQILLDRPMAAGRWPEPVVGMFVAQIGVRSVFVFGLSPRLPFNSAYEGFLLQVVDSIDAMEQRVNAITRRVRADGEHRALLLQAPVATAVMTGPDLVFELANPRYVEMVGREVLGKKYVEAFPEIVGTPLLETVQRVYDDGVPYSTSEMCVQLDRKGTGELEDVYFMFNLQPIRDDAGAVEGMMVLAVEITQQVNARHAQAQAGAKLQAAHDERAKLIDQLKLANQAKDEFLALLGHELRNPLAPIVTALELQRLRQKGEISREHQIMERQVGHLVRLVDDLLDVSRIATGKVELKKEHAEIGAVVARATEMTESLVETRNHRLTLDIPEPIPWWGDPTRLAQVVSNLLTNAARYTEVGGDITVSARAQEGWVVMCVADNGKGIGPELQPRVFDMFVQGLRKSDRREGGLGLGLSLVKNLVQLHGGTVSVRSEGLGCGSTFEVRLPIIAPGEDPARESLADITVAAEKAARPRSLPDRS